MEKPAWPDGHAFLSMLRGLLTVQPITIETHETGLALAERYNLSISDAMIAAAALHADCGTLWSQDMQHGMALGEGLRITNPFRACELTSDKKTKGAWLLAQSKNLDAVPGVGAARLENISCADYIGRL